MKDNSHSRNQKKRWMEGRFIGKARATVSKYGKG